MQVNIISSLSNHDRARLVCKYNSLYKKEAIDPAIFENRTEAEIKYLRKTMGSTLNMSCGMEFTQEFKDYPDYGHFNFVMMANNAFNKSGVLPFPGSLSEQPAQIMEIFETLYELEAERERDHQEKVKKDRNKNG